MSFAAQILNDVIMGEWVKKVIFKDVKDAVAGQDQNFLKMSECPFLHDAGQFIINSQKQRQILTDLQSIFSINIAGLKVKDSKYKMYLKAHRHLTHYLIVTCFEISAADNF